MAGTQWRSHGLTIGSDFAIAGVEETLAGDAQAIDLTMRISEPAHLRAQVHGEPRSLLWQGLQGDGATLSIERTGSGDLLFTYGEHASFLLSAALDVLDCAPYEDGPRWQRALVGKVIPAIAVMRGFEALHAAALSGPDGVIAFMAPSGTGKSTLAASLIESGWTLFADDQLTLVHSADGAVAATPGGPHLTVSTLRPTQLIGETLGMLGEERWMAVERFAREDQPVTALFLYERGSGLRLGAQPLEPNPLPLSPYVLGISADERRLAARFQLFADLVQSSRLFALTAETDEDPMDVARFLDEVTARKADTATNR